LNVFIVTNFLSTLLVSSSLQVSAGLVLQQMFILCPDAVGAMSKAERAALRPAWYKNLARNKMEEEKYAGRVLTPPLPLSDLRRDITHRTGWTSKNTKDKNDKAAGGAGFRR
jgi:hypothetical protein